MPLFAKSLPATGDGEINSVVSSDGFARGALARSSRIEIDDAIHRDAFEL